MATTPEPPHSVNAVEAWRCLLRYHARATGEVSSRLQSELGLTLAEFEVLTHLDEHPSQRMPMSELARKVVLTPSGITRMVDRLVARNLLERQAVRSDGRVSHAVLTEFGSQILSKATMVHTDAVEQLFAEPLPQQQRASLAAMLATLNRSIEPGSSNA